MRKIISNLPVLRSLSLLALVASAALGAAEPVVVDRFALFENGFTAAGTYANPYTDCAAQAIVTAPDGTQRQASLFWDGGATWRLRFAPDQVGEWRWSVRSADSGLNGQKGIFACRASARRGSIRGRSDAPHHFQYQNGEPLWFLGDTAWAFVTDVPAEKHDDSAVARYLERRVAQGFNAIHVMLMSEAGDGNAGGAPFAPLAEEKINPAYWQAVDRRVALANARGVVLGLALAWGRKNASSATAEPYSWGRFPNQAARERYARYIGARYGAYDVYFLVSGEWHGEVRTRPGATGAALRDEFVALGHALRAADPQRRMIGIHPMSQDGSTREFNRAAWMDFGDYQQNYRLLHDRILTSRHYAKPVVNSEYAYFLRDQDGDGRPDKDNSLNADDIRHASWDIAMAGGYFVTGFGTTYFGGNREPGPFDPGATKNAVWEEQVQHLKKFLEGIEYWRLIPADLQLTAETPRGAERTERQEALTPKGRARSIIRPPANTYWALQIPGELYVLYVRGLAATATFALEGVGGRYAVARYNPRTGETTPVGVQVLDEPVDRAQLAVVGGSAAKRPAAGSHRYTFVPPDRQDWVIVLKRSSDSASE